jgi:23S rRNA pseudouridine1911/1915/1917 synthase
MVIMFEKQFDVPNQMAGIRLDAFVVRVRPELSRARIQRLIAQGRVLVGGRARKAAHRVRAGEKVQVSVPPESPPEHLVAEDIPLEVIYEDEDLIVVNKPRGLVVHPGAGRRSGTLVNALLAHARISAGEALRPGIVHRLDKDTSGLMVVARNEEAFAALSRMVRAREVERIYLALVWGDLGKDRFTIEAPIGRHPSQRKRMAALPDRLGRPGVRAAVTEVTARRRFGPATLVQARLVTGRTHQIRVHMAHIGHPLIGDPVYGGRRGKRQLTQLDEPLRGGIAALSGQALHAASLSFLHPRTGERLHFSTPIPRDMALVVRCFENAGPQEGERRAPQNMRRARA